MRALAVLLGALAAGLVPGAATAQDEHRLAFVYPAGHWIREGVIRIVNRSDRRGVVNIEATDDGGERYGPVTLSIAANSARQLTSGDLERGNAAKGLPVGIGDGTGGWRLRLTSALDVEALAYIHSAEGLLTSTHDVVREVGAAGGGYTYRVPLFNPGSNTGQVSQLRLANNGERDARITIVPDDDSSQGPRQSATVRLTLPAGEATMLTARELEEGCGVPCGFTGAFGDGTGRWWLEVRSNESIEVMNLLVTWHSLSNLSTGPATAPGTLAFVYPAGQWIREGFLRIVNRSDRRGEVNIEATDADGRRYGPVTLSIAANSARQLSSEDLERGNAAKGLPVGIGDGAGIWRLRLTSALDVEALAYVRSTDGLLTSTHDVVREVGAAGGGYTYRVPFFNPGSDRGRRSWLAVNNNGERDARITIVPDDDSPQGPRESAAVRLTLAAGRSTILTAQELEEGCGVPCGFTGAFGDGTGKWWLEVRSNESIEVMNLLASSHGGLSNLSTSPVGTAAPPPPSDFTIAAGGPTSVRPLQTIPLNLPGGLGDADYRIQIDLSGTGAFNADHTIETTGLTTDQDQLLVASPLTQVLPDRNTAHRFAVRVRRESDRELSNVLRFTIDDITIPANRAGYPTVTLQVILKALYASSDDPLLKLGEPSIHPGLMVLSARRLGLDTQLSDVQAEAVLQSVFGVSGMSSAGDASSSANLGCGVFRRACEAWNNMYHECLGPAMAKYIRGGDPTTDLDRCSNRFGLELEVGILEDVPGGLGKIATIGKIAHSMAPKWARKLISKSKIQQLSTRAASYKPTVDLLKTGRTVSDFAEGAQDFVRDASESSLRQRKP